MLKLYLVSLSLILFSCKETKTKVVHKLEYQNISCDTLYLNASKMYNSPEFDAIVLNFRKAAECAVSKDNRKIAGYAYLNIATLFEERLNEIDSVLHYASKSLMINQDSFHSANLHKYLGLIYGLENQKDSSDYHFLKSTQIFKSLDKKLPLGVVQYDQAKVDYNFKAYDESKKHFEAAMIIWGNTSQSNRIFEMNNFGMNLMFQLKDTLQIENLIKSNEALILSDKENINSNKIDSFNILKQYFLENS